MSLCQSGQGIFQQDVHLMSHYFLKEGSFVNFEKFHFRSTTSVIMLHSVSHSQVMWPGSWRTHPIFILPTLHIIRVFITTVVMLPIGNLRSNMFPAKVCEICQNNSRRSVLFCYFVHGGKVRILCHLVHGGRIGIHNYSVYGMYN